MRFRRHRCPPSVVLSIFMDGDLVIGPLDSEALAYIARYSGDNGKIDLLGLDGEAIRDIRVIAEYKEPPR